MSTTDPLHARIREQVLHGLAHNRTPGLHFLAHFLDVAFDSVGESGAHLHLPGGPHCIDAAGQIHVAPLGLLADLAMAATVRAVLPRETRLGTVSMQLQFSNTPWYGPLDAHAALDGFLAEGERRLGYTRGTLWGRDGMICTGSATFMVLAPPGGRVLAPVPHRRRDDPPPTPLQESILDDAERAILGHADALLARMRASPELGFADHYFGFETERRAAGARATLRNGPHIGNRVGHVQGGVSFAFGMATAQAALGPEWRLSNVTASYVSPGQGPILQARAAVVHRGRGTAVVRTRVIGAERRIVLEVLSNHLRREE